MKGNENNKILTTAEEPLNVEVDQIVNFAFSTILMKATEAQIYTKVILLQAS